MEFMPTREAIQTCVLSKRWKNVWKSLDTFSLKPLNGIRKYNQFVSKVLSNRDDSVSLRGFQMPVFSSTAPKLLKAIEYGARHNLQKLTLAMDFRFKEIPVSLVPLIFNCQSLTFLDLYINSSCSNLKLPPSILLPSLETLYLSNVTFTATDNHCIDPFSTCTSLTTLVLQHDLRYESTQTLLISNPNLSVLKLESVVSRHTFNPKLVLSTPNLSLITLGIQICYELSCTCDLPLLEEVYVNQGVHTVSSVIINWLQLFPQVKTLRLSSYALEMLLKDVVMTGIEIQPPSFFRLKSMKMEIGRHMISDDHVDIILDYLLRNCQTIDVEVDAITED
ncbi:unnamed protein product [Sphenostylis stenocarpa]|uniref:Uncharacterized protein n=1 Tax=Sphenostylis stenocarpa TaxID=92480 RepID=A0AA86S6H3_9FABA|nr:unnamed protein product [Sphenostylis stenocarpa]